MATSKGLFLRVKWRRHGHARGPRLIGSPTEHNTSKQALANGDFKFTLEGEAAASGGFVLVRMASDRERGKAYRGPPIKHREEFAMPGNGAIFLEENDTSVASGRPKAVSRSCCKAAKCRPMQSGTAGSGLAAEERKAGHGKENKGYHCP